MRGRLLDKYNLMYYRRRFVSRALLIVAAILICLIVVTYYGYNVGNFVIRVDNDHYQGLSLSDDENRVTLSNYLVAKSLHDCKDADISFIPDNIEEGIGSKNHEEGRYFCYSFYLINVGKLTCNYVFEYKLVRSTKDIDKALRVMIIQDGHRDIYAKSRTDEGHIGDPEPIICLEENNIIGETLPFIELEDRTIIKNYNYDFMAGSYTKYTVVMWIDGWDKDESDEMFGSLIQTEVTISLLK